MYAGPLQIAVAADAQYFIPLVVLLKSIEVNLRSCTPATVWIVDAGLKRRQRRIIGTTADAEQLRVRWLQPPDRRNLRGLPVFGHVNASTYFRIFLPELLPKLDKVIYLDVDMLVLADMGDLWSREMNDVPLLAVQDNNCATVGNSSLDYFRDLGLRSEAKLFNGGLLVMDLASWRQNDFTQAMIEFLRLYENKVKFWDQDALNAILVDRWEELPYEWNWRIDCGIPRGEGLIPHVPEECARILHFSSATKPWHYYCDHTGKDIFFEYLDKTELANWRPHRPWRVLFNRHYWGARLGTAAKLEAAQGVLRALVGKRSR